MSMDELTLRPLEDANLPLVAEWLNKPHIEKWYAPVDEWLAEIRERNGRFSWLRHFVVMDGDVPVGFCQYYDCFDSAGLEDWNGREFPRRGEVYSIDYLIGEENYLGKGYGKALVRMLTDMMFALGAREIIVDPDEENARSSGVLTANGYTYDDALGYFSKKQNERKTT
jgi:RimJ/RimL family protein N-acetyltransferase